MDRKEQLLDQIDAGVHSPDFKEQLLKAMDIFAKQEAINFAEFIELNFVLLLLITIIISTTSQLGDLFISYLKRKAKVKNTSNILPGHGGFLDRVDGIIFATPIGILLFNYL